MTTRHVVTKSPNRYGVNTVVLDPSGLSAHPALVVAGNVLVELGLVMGVYDAQDIAKLEFGDVLQPREESKDWCALSRWELASCAADALCPHMLHVDRCVLVAVLSSLYRCICACRTCICACRTCMLHVQVCCVCGA